MSALWVRMPLAKVKSNPSNPRIIKDDKFRKLVQSIRDFPEMLELRPIVVDADGVVLGGNMRLRAAKEAGLSEVPVIRADHLTAEQQREFVVKDNVGFGEWDWEALANEWDMGQLESWGMDVPAVEVQPTAGLTDADDVPETPKEPITKVGDRIVLGRHTLVCGDSSDPAVVNLALQDVIPDAIITDPPYGIGIDGQKKSIAKNPKHNRKEHEFRGWDQERPNQEIFRYIDSLDCPKVIWGGNYFSDLLPPTRGWIYWNKGQDGLTMSDGELAWTSEHKPLRSVLVNRSSLRGSVHPTQKPVSVIRFSMDYIDAQTVVFDMFAGSGTTLIACEQTGRAARLIELDPKYCDVIVRRWEEFTGQKAIRPAS